MKKYLAILLSVIVIICVGLSIGFGIFNLFKFLIFDKGIEIWIVLLACIFIISIIFTTVVYFSTKEDKGNEEAKDLLDNLIGMVEDNQNNDYDEALKLAIRSINAWEEVLNQLQEWKNNAENKHEQKIVYAYFSAIELINQKLAEIGGSDIG